MKKVGRQVLFLETGPGNPRNGEGSFLRLRDGSIFFGYTEYTGSGWHDHASARLSCLISRDEGETWGEKGILLEKPENCKNIMSLSLLRMGNGDVGAFYIRKNLDGTDGLWLIRSSDEGKTWSEPINCMGAYQDTDYYVLNNDRVLRLKNGRILFSACRHSIFTGSENLAPGVVCFFCSDDDGFTWRKTNTEFAMPFPGDPVGFQEPGLYEREDGSLWCYLRTRLGCQFQCFSQDGGESWSFPEPNYFFSSPDSPMLVKDAGRCTLAVFNPIPRYTTRPESEPWGRTPLVCAVSHDRGKTFSKEGLYAIEEDLSNGYCYPALLEGPNCFLLAYYHSNGTGICLNSCKIVKVSLDELQP